MVDAGPEPTYGGKVRVTHLGNMSFNAIRENKILAKISNDCKVLLL